MKGDITRKILEKLEEAVFESADLMVSIMTSSYRASIGELEYNKRKIQEEREEFIEKIKQVRIAKQNYRNLICKLKKDGLIEEKMRGDKKFLVITKRGLSKLNKLNNTSPKPPTYYEKEKIGETIVVIFDIPETRSKQRAWIREVLKNLDFQMAQKSVWIGKTQIPEEFIKNLNDQKLDNFVQIFSTTKTGNLKQII